MREATNPGHGTVASKRANKIDLYKLAGVSIAPLPFFVNPRNSGAFASTDYAAVALGRGARVAAGI